MQTKTESFLEEATKTAIKFMFAIAITEWIVWPLVDIGWIKVGESFFMTVIFTISSIIISYFLRRYFNGRT